MAVERHQCLVAARLQPKLIGRRRWYRLVSCGQCGSVGDTLVAVGAKCAHLSGAVACRLMWLWWWWSSGVNGGRVEIEQVCAAVNELLGRLVAFHLNRFGLFRNELLNCVRIAKL